MPGTVEFMIGGRLGASLPLVVESGLSRPGAIRFAGLIRRPSSKRGGLRDYAATSEPLHP